VSVDTLIYRVEAFTKQTLNGNFNLLCRKCIIEGKVNVFFWSYHKANDEILWEVQLYEYNFDRVAMMVT